MNRQKIIAGNWKMNKSFEEGLSLCSEVTNMLDDEVNGEVQVILVPPFLHIHALSQLVKKSKRVSIGGQNCHYKQSGAFTGEVSASMLKSAGADYVIIGHSERREYFNEKEDILAIKIQLALESGLTPIYCVGEIKAERESGDFYDVIRKQLNSALAGFSASEVSQIIIAYEPVWAIGTGLTATPEQAQEIHSFIRSEIESLFSSVCSQQIPILYGGSVNANNAAALFSMPDIDGGLVGGASLKSRDFVNIIKSI